MRVELPPTVWVAIIGLFGVIVTAFYGPSWKTRLDRRTNRINRLEELLGRYQKPLLSAAYELQSRLYNIVLLRFLETYYRQRTRRWGVGKAGHRQPGDDEHHYAEASTLWILTQYLAWAEILRREVQFLDLGDVRRNRELQHHLTDISDAFATDSIKDSAFRIFRADQRAIGEIAIVERTQSDGTVYRDCLGYADFVTRLETDLFRSWFARLRGELQEIADAPRKHARLVRIQHALVNLVDFLDPEQVHYPNRNTRGRALLPATPSNQRKRHRASVARFVYIERSPWAVFEEWCSHTRLERRGRSRYRHSARGPTNRLGVRLKIVATYTRGWLEFCAYTEPPSWARSTGLLPSKMSLDDQGWLVRALQKEARRTVNDLLRRFGRPPVL
jgi:hypothetical protein